MFIGYFIIGQIIIPEKITDPVSKAVQYHCQILMLHGSSVLVNECFTFAPSITMPWQLECDTVHCATVGFASLSSVVTMMVY